MKSEPALPRGYLAQPVREVVDRKKGYAYEFNNVYKPPYNNHRGALRLLDKSRSYWRVTRFNGSEYDGERRWLTYEQALGLSEKDLSFEHFASLREMRATLRELFEE